MLGYLENILLQDDIEKIWELHCDLMAQYGFDRLIYGFMPFTSTPGHEDPADAFVLSNHDPEYLKEFIKGNLFIHAPMVRWTTRNVGACSWSWVQERKRKGLLTPGELKVLELNQRYDVKAGVSIAFSDSSRRAKGGIGLCAERGLSQEEVDELWERHGRELIVLNSILHLRISTMPVMTARRALTDRQRQVLEWVADGKTTADIATIMGLTNATVEKHLRLAREALDVETTAQAVVKATLQKQLFSNRIPTSWNLLKED
ncbi:helix-turn-helix transcriptional regulator [Paenirhodobacter populi]|uniref:LuxR family transcriptional regulator n=1 Tax=Paenirhodobacter populi TaxID=2306993 RepID=A0A443JA37_9RHOB|nr:LuxR family transcriptional regulator [Sinirhodobacter populi]RWR17392.1 LuxR family transcriptional regulator [Sinirhodobacter populi]